MRDTERTEARAPAHFHEAFAIARKHDEQACWSYDADSDEAVCNALLLTPTAAKAVMAAIPGAYVDRDFGGVIDGDEPPFVGLTLPDELSAGTAE